MAQTGTTNDFDSGLLNRDEESQAAGELREGRRGGDVMTDNALNMVDPSGAQQKMGETGSFREWADAMRQATRIKRQVESLTKEKLATMATAPAKQGLNYLLKAAWLNLIDSFGLTLIWINLHVFLRYSVSDKLFCRLGEEWLPKQAALTGGDAAETANKGIGLLEIMVLLILDLIILFVIFIILALIVMIVQFMQASWWEKLVGTLKVFWGTGWDSIKALFDLFTR